MNKRKKSAQRTRSISVKSKSHGAKPNSAENLQPNRSASAKSKSRGAKSNSVDNVPSPIDDSHLDALLREHLHHVQSQLRVIYAECLSYGSSLGVKSTQCKSHILQHVRRYLDELKDEAQMQNRLQTKVLQGRTLTADEQQTLDALQLKCDTMRASSLRLEQAQQRVRLTAEQHEVLAANFKNSKTSPGEQHFVLVQARMQCEAALVYAKRALLNLLKQRWATQTLLAVSLAGLLSWAAHRVILSTVVVTTALLREASQMVHTVHATTELVGVGSREGAKWAIGTLGGAVGAANGLFLSSLLPGSNGKTAASILSSAAVGLYAGLRALS